MYALDRAANRLFRHDDGVRWFDAATRSWHAATVPPGLARISAAEALAWLQNASGHPLRAPISVVGPREEDAARNAVAEAVGEALGGVGLTILCGGRGGVMRAVCAGAARADGLTIGLLPEADGTGANEHVRVTIASGIGEARNAIIACGGAALVVIGDSYGTLSEVALGLRFGKAVFGLCQPPRVAGVRALASVDELLPALAAHLLGHDAAA